MKCVSKFNEVAMAQEKKWIVQRCVNALKNQYEDWPGYCETPMTYDEVMKALKECEREWPYEFRGHNVGQRPASA